MAGLFSGDGGTCASVEKKIVVDRFHVMKKINESVDRVRKQEHRELLKKGGKRLVGTRSIWRYAETNLPDRYHEQQEAMRKMNLKVKSGLGDQGKLASVMGLCNAGKGEGIFQHMVSVGNTFPVASNQELSQDGEEAHNPDSEHLPSSHNKCGGGRTAQQNPDSQAAGLRIPQLGKHQSSDHVLLRKIENLPIRIDEGRFF